MADTTLVIASHTADSTAAGLALGGAGSQGHTPKIRGMVRGTRPLRNMGPESARVNLAASKAAGCEP